MTIPIHEIRHRTSPAEEQNTQAPPLAASRFGLAIGRIMHAFDIMEMPVATATGEMVGTLQLSTGTLGRISQTCVAWEHIEELEIQQHIHDIAGRDLPLECGVFAVWDSAGLQRLDAYRNEIMAAVVAIVATSATNAALGKERWAGAVEQ